jgi:hypothetical protein
LIGNFLNRRFYFLSRTRGGLCEIGFGNSRANSEILSLYLLFAIWLQRRRRAGGERFERKSSLF